MHSANRRLQGFALIELMIVVAILGVLASVAIPSFVTYVRRARAAEASDQLKELYALAASYYFPERSERGISGGHTAGCVVDPADNGVIPTSTKQRGDYSGASWRALGFSHEFAYYRLEIVRGAPGQCHVPANTSDLYTMRATGDLDGDGASSLFELAIASNGENEPYHSRAFYVVAETE